MLLFAASIRPGASHPGVNAVPLQLTHMKLNPQHKTCHMPPHTTDLERLRSSFRLHPLVRARVPCIRPPATAPLAAAGSPGATTTGHCWLVGAGPGDPELLTLRAVSLLKQADVIVYDDLGAQGALQHAPASAEQVYVGKRGGKPSYKQADIDQLLVQHVLKGQRVVRLKGGCPSVFSRVSSEVAALADAGCAYELVPGVSSALAAPVLAGFPLTDAICSSSFAVVSGHAPDTIDWSTFDRVPTLVVLMGGRSLPDIVSHLANAAGKAPGTPVCIIRAASMPEQQVWYSSLSKIVADTAGVDLSPCILVVGQVAALPRTWHAQH